MRALHVPAAGELPRVSDIATPEPGEGQVLIRVKAAGLNPIDNAIAAGMLTAMMPHEYPLIIGRDAAGVVESVGAGVGHVKAGDEVYGHVLLAPPVQAGTLAEYALLPAATVNIKPAGLDFIIAAAIPLAGAAAATAIAAIDVQAGQTVLVNGASGGVGQFAVQALVAAGVTVIATGTSADVERLKDLGAAQVIDYTTGPVAEQVLALHPDGVDALINLAGHTAEEVPLAAVSKGGKVATTTMAPDDAALAAHGLTGSSVMALPLADVTGRLGEQAERGDLKVHVGTVLDLDHAADGLATLAAGKSSGKIIVKIAD